jgi:hypothetical protein
MQHTRITRPLGKALQFYAALALAIVLFQLVGLGMYLYQHGLTIAGDGGASAAPSDAVLFLLAIAVVVGFIRWFVWIAIYWRGSKAFGLIDADGDSLERSHRLSRILEGLTRLLVLSFVLDVLFLPAYFLSDVVLPFPLAGWRLGLVEVARILLPQAFGIAALFLAFLTHQYAQLLEEHGAMQSELELTV